MAHVLPASALFIFVAIQVVGLASAVLARAGEGSIRQVSCQRIFFFCLLLVAGTTMLAIWVGTVACLICGTTLAAMVLGATYDVGEARRATAR
jgi:hypothetical protein